MTGLEPIVDPNRVDDDIGWKSVTFIRIHRPILSVTAGELVEETVRNFQYIVCIGQNYLVQHRAFILPIRGDLTQCVWHRIS
jgi:hypothetical protein